MAAAKAAAGGERRRRRIVCRLIADCLHSTATRPATVAAINNECKAIRIMANCLACCCGCCWCCRCCFVETARKQPSIAVAALLAALALLAVSVCVLVCVLRRG